MPAIVLCSDACETARRAAAPSDTPWQSLPLATYLAHVAMVARIANDTLENLERLVLAAVEMDMRGESR